MPPPLRARRVVDRAQLSWLTRAQAEEALKLRPWRINSPPVVTAQARAVPVPAAAKHASSPTSSSVPILAEATTTKPSRTDFPPSIAGTDEADHHHFIRVRRGVVQEVNAAAAAAESFGDASRRRTLPSVRPSTSVLKAVPSDVPPSAKGLLTASSAAATSDSEVVKAEAPKSTAVVTTGLVTAAGGAGMGDTVAPSTSRDAQAAAKDEDLTSTVIVIASATPTPAEVVSTSFSTAQEPEITSASLQSLEGGVGRVQLGAGWVGALVIGAWLL